MSDRGEELIEQRRAKLQRLRAAGCDPYPARYQRTHTTQEAAHLLQQMEEKEPALSETKGAAAEPQAQVSLAGRVTAMRVMGKRTFVDLRDGSGKIQADLRRDVLGDEGYRAFVDLVDIG
ncbi:MAG: OB-fold nucleic acid binding domain-containing protein, partial [Chloroflexota bacterium]|nr:OB-fold nucleic acid binding domain-containing protein [Chloroflexota bacterium]